MKKITLFFASMVFCLLASNVSAQTFSGAGGLAIPAAGSGGGACLDNTMSDATSTLTGTIGTDFTIDNVTIDLVHTWDADLDITLISPDGNTLDLSSDNGGGSDDYTNTVFQDGAPSITTGSAPFTGTFQPEGGTFADAFTGDNVAGIWQLNICDDVGGDTGTLNSYSITFVAVPPFDFVPVDITLPLDENGMASIIAADVIDGAIVEPEGTGVFLPYGGSGLGVAISDNATVQTSTNVSDSGIIGQNIIVDNVSIDISHTWDSDMSITLIAPSGATLDLSSGNGGSGDNYTDTVFEDGAPSITTSGAPFTGTFEAEGGTFAAAFAGEEINGDWTLQVTDSATGDPGVINDFFITFEEANVVTLIPDGNGGFTSNITLSQMDFTCADIGDVVITIVADNNMGQMATHMATVTVVDDMGPQISGPIDIFTGSGSGDCSKVVNYDPVTFVDNCDSAATITQTGGLGSGSAFPVGVTTEEYTAMDVSGNTSVFSFNITITDTAAPTFACPGDYAVSPDATGNYTIGNLAAGAADNCTAEADLVITQDPAEGTVVADGSVNDVTITITDEAGNVTTCNFVLTVDATLGLNDVALDSAISLYPNPTDGQITLRNGGLAQLTTVVISDINGRIVSTIDVSEMSGERQISLDNLAAGMYFAKISTDNAFTVKRIIRK